MYDLELVNDTVWSASDTGCTEWNPSTHKKIRDIPGFCYSIRQHRNTVWLGGDGNVRLYDLEVRCVASDFRHRTNV